MGNRIITAKGALLAAAPYGETASKLVRRWLSLIEDAVFTNTSDVQHYFSGAEHITGTRWVFNLGGNKYRLVASVNIEHRTVRFIWFGTHKEYDQIDVKTIEYRPP